MERTKKIIVYISHYNFIGGVERFTENLCKRLCQHYNVTLLFDNCNHNQLLFEMSDFATIEKLDKNKKYTSDYFISATAWGEFAHDHVKAKKYIQMVHADYRHVIDNWNFKYNKHKKTTHHVCVGNLVKQAFEEATPYKCDAVIYNLLDTSTTLKPKPKNNVLTLITVSRLSKEKGFERMIKFAEYLQLKKIDYIWNVYGDRNVNYEAKFKNTKVNFKGIIRNPIHEINKADYLVQLSDTEGFSYSIYEALQSKTPCLITPFESGKEQITNGVNGYFIPFDVKEIPDILNIPVIKDFKEKSTEKDWIKFLEQ